ncbi:hypothetical protein [Streptomyces sp. MK5]|uniref:hypothetical protein n=1 Tax=Streptomyces sp. MK5 TaxID=3064253 RepID=UPI002740ACFC|nr:hypothetical protein [Streptomyces sp. MK5]
MHKLVQRAALATTSAAITAAAVLGAEGTPSAGVGEVGAADCATEEHGGRPLASG